MKKSIISKGYLFSKTVNDAEITIVSINDTEFEGDLILFGYLTFGDCIYPFNAYLSRHKICGAYLDEVLTSAFISALITSSTVGGQGGLCEIANVAQLCGNDGIKHFNQDYKSFFKELADYLLLNL